MNQISNVTSVQVQLWWHST